jgi:hypothetical protein
MLDTLARIKKWKEEGVFVVPGFLSLQEIARLRQICDFVLEQVRKTSSNLGHSTANIAFLTEPNYFQQSLAPLIEMLEFIGSWKIRSLIEDLRLHDRSDSQLLFHNTQYFHEQTFANWDGDWHRDSQFMYSDAAERDFALSTTAIHFRVAFVPDDRLEFVRGSHCRWDTEKEKAIRTGMTPNSSDMPGTHRVELGPGDACVFHAWGIHRGPNRPHPVRRTLDLIYAFAPCPPDPALPGPTCFQIPEVLNSLSSDCRLFFDKFIAAYEPYWKAAADRLTVGSD